MNTVKLDLFSFTLLFNPNTNLFLISADFSANVRIVQSDISANVKASEFPCLEMVVYFSPYAYPLYYTSDLLARGFPAAF